MLQPTSVPKTCDDLLQRCKEWAHDNGNYPVLRWDQFGRTVGWEANELLEAATNYLHEAGHLIWFKDYKEVTESHAPKAEGSQESSGRTAFACKNLVVLSPEYFCQKVVGHLLLPGYLLENNERSLAMEYMDSGDSSVPLAMIGKKEFGIPEGRCDEMVGMFLRLGLGYAHESNQDRVYIPAVIDTKDPPSWFTDACRNGKRGSSWIMGFCLKSNRPKHTLVPVAILRQLQVNLAYDNEIGGRKDSEYLADMSRIWFKWMEMGVLVEFCGEDSETERLDVLVVQLVDRSNEPLYDPVSERRAQLDVAHRVVQRAQILKAVSCPGLHMEKWIIKPWMCADGLQQLSNRDVTISVQSVIQRIKEKGVEEKLQWPIDGRSLVKCVDVLAVEDMRDVERSFQVALNLTKTCIGELDLCDPLQIVEEDAEDADSQSHEGTSTTETNDQSALVLEDLHSRFDKLEVRVDEHFNKVDEHFNKGDEHFNKLDEHFNKLEEHFNKLEEKLSREFAALKGNVYKVLREQESLNQHVLSLEAFVVQEQEKSVPRFAYLKKEAGQNSVGKVWIKISEAFRYNSTLHFMCEARHDDGKLHEVENQVGVKVTEAKEWVQKLSPILNWALKLAFVAAEVAGAAVLPGLGILLPDLSPDLISNSSQMVNGVSDLGKLFYDHASMPAFSTAEATSTEDARLSRGEALDFVREILKAEKSSY